MDKHKGQPRPLFGELVKKIEQLSGTHFSLGQGTDFNLRQQRAHEAHLAALEISQALQRARRQTAADLHARGAVDPRFTFASIVVDKYNKDAVGSAQLLCATAGHDGPVPLLFIQGAEGTGKSVLCHAIANEWLASISSAVLICSFEELRKLRLFRSNEERVEREDRDEQWEKCCTLSLLLIDGLQCFRDGLTSFGQQLFGELLRRRHELGLPMVITTPLDFSALKLAVGTYCFESFREYGVITRRLYGPSRRQPFIVDGKPLT